MKDVYTIREAAEHFGISPKTVSREIKRGNLKCMRIGRCVRITRQQIETYVTQQGGA